MGEGEAPRRWSLGKRPSREPSSRGEDTLSVSREMLTERGLIERKTCGKAKTIEGYCKDGLSESYSSFPKGSAKRKNMGIRVFRRKASEKDLRRERSTMATFRS